MYKGRLLEATEDQGTCRVDRSVVGIYMFLGTRRVEGLEGERLGRERREGGREGRG